MGCKAETNSKVTLHTTSNAYPTLDKQRTFLFSNPLWEQVRGG